MSHISQTRFAVRNYCITVCIDIAVLTLADQVLRDLSGTRATSLRLKDSLRLARDTCPGRLGQRTWGNANSDARYRPSLDFCDFAGQST